MTVDDEQVPLATNKGVTVAWLPRFFDKELTMSLGKKVGIGATAGVVGLIILL